MLLPIHAVLDDLKAALAGVSGDQAFAAEFFARYVQGRDVVDYARLLERAGLLLRPAAPGQPFVGNLRLQDVPGSGPRVVATETHRPSEP